MGEAQVQVEGAGRMSAEQRRDDLIDIALELLCEQGMSRVTIGSVAKIAGVTRTLIYKHFTNREDLIQAVYLREADKLHGEISDRVVQVTGFENRLRAFVSAVIDAVDTHGWLFSPTEPQTHEVSFRDAQAQRDRRTVSEFAKMASSEFNLSFRQATSAMGILLSGFASIRLQARVLTSDEDRRALVDLYIDIVLIALRGLSEDARYSSNGEASLI